MTKPKADKLFFFIVLALLAIGFVIFFSASQSLLSRSNGADFGLVATKQFVILVIGLAALLMSANIPYKIYREKAFWIYLISVLVTLLVFIPGLGFGSGGAKRWISIASFTTFQPSELLKFGFIAYAAYWLSSGKDVIKSFRHGVLPFLVILLIPALILVKEPDLGTLMVLCSAGLAMFIAAGARWKHMFLLASLIAALVFVLAKADSVPGLNRLVPSAVTDKFAYVERRLDTFLHPEKDMLGKSYQINQSMIAIGSGGLAGRGFGQSVQKFNFLPEAIGDSIFAVLSEEFGFLGATILVLFYAAFALWGLKIASRVPDAYGRLMALGIVILISAQAFINISAMMGLIPLTGVPLTFVSHGGSALIIALMEVGVVLNISRNQTK